MKWRIGDIVDLEYFLHADTVSHSAGQQGALHERDRNIFLQFVMPGVKEGERPDRQSMVRAWLNRRRASGNDGAALPGEAVESLYSALRFWFPVAGLLAGGVAGVSFLAYTGDSPVNVFVYLSLFVFSQLLLLLVLFVLSTHRLMGRAVSTSSPLYRLIGRFMLRMVLSAGNRVAEKLSADRRLRAENAVGAVIGKTRTYGVLFFLPVFILTQLFGVGFNLGLLAATLFKVVTSDIAFGWQSTIQLSPSAVHSLARVIAVPWSWVLGDAAVPSLEQVEGSRIILKEGIYHLATPDLASWWPFLCLAVLVYGLLPRLFLFLMAVAAKRRFLGSLDFRQGSCEQLLLRMSTPLVTTRGRKVEEAAAASREPGPESPARVEPTEGDAVARKNLLVLIPDEIFAACSRPEIESMVNRGPVFAIGEIIRFNQDYAADRELLARLGSSSLPAETQILVIQEAWQPPIMEYIDFIKQLRRAVGAAPCIRIGLIGKPRPDTVFTPAQEENLAVWIRKIAAIGDPCLYAEGLVTDA